MPSRIMPSALAGVVTFCVVEIESVNALAFL